MHSGTIGIENPCHFDLDLILSMIIEEQGFGTSLPFVIAGTRSNTIDISPIGFRLRMDRRVSIDLGGRGLKDLGSQSFGQPEHIDGPMDVYFRGLNGVILIMNRRGRTGKIINFIHLDIEREGDVVTKEFEIWLV